MHERPFFFDVTECVDAAELKTLDDYLLSHIDLSSGKVKLTDGEVLVFPAEGGKYGDALELCDRDTSTWCADVFTSFGISDDFVQCRAHRGDPATWRPNYNGRVLLPGVLDFVRKLPFFQTLQATGKVAIICNEPGSEGIEHTDHKIDQLVSEFVWIRTCSSTKRFFVRDPSTKERHFAGGEPGSGPARACVGWFDDRFPHCLAAHDEKLQFSIRVDGRFTPEFRERVALTGRFASQLVPTEGGRADVLRAATDGPRFLSEENPNEPNYSDEDEDDEDVDNEDEDDEDDEDEAEDEDGSEEEESALDRASR